MCGPSRPLDQFGRRALRLAHDKRHRRGATAKTADRSSKEIDVDSKPDVDFLIYLLGSRVSRARDGFSAFRARSAAGYARCTRLAEIS